MTLNNNTDVNGNRDVKQLLEQFQNAAKERPIGYLAIVGAEEPNQFMLGYSGTVELEKVAVEGLKKGITGLEANILNRTMPEPDSSLDASYVAYNITCSPLSYDFLTWLISQEMQRQKAGAPGPLKVGFWLGRNGGTGLGGMPDRQQMLNRVCRPAISLLSHGAVEHPVASKGRFDEFFSYRRIVELCNEGIPVPKFRTNLRVPITPGYVTITLRETTYWPHRNSKLEEWLMFANYLKARGERVIFVRDTAKANEPVPGFETFPAASVDLETRCALYQQAKCNCFVANGPVSLGYFGDTPWLKFMEIDDNGAYNAARSEYWRQCVGLDPAKQEQFPWSTDKQRIVWKPDYYTNLVVAWEEMWNDKAPVEDKQSNTKELPKRKKRN